MRPTRMSDRLFAEGSFQSLGRRMNLVHVGFQFADSQITLVTRARYLVTRETKGDNLMLFVLGAEGEDSIGALGAAGV